MDNLRVVYISSACIIIITYAYVNRYIAGFWKSKRYITDCRPTRAVNVPLATACKFVNSLHRFAT